MDRKKFIKTLGTGTGALIFLSCMGSCSSSSDDPTPNNPNNPGSKIDFTFDVTSDSNLTNSGWTIRNGVIIAKSGSNYLAFQADCTHQGSALTYNASSNTFPCSLQGPGHGSVFNANGERIAGPASGNLKKYSTQLNGNNLRVFEA